MQSPFGSDPAPAAVHADAPLHTPQSPHWFPGSEPFATGEAHAPRPLQVTHVPHDRLLGGKRHAEAPLHTPPQVPVPAHSLSGSAASAMGLHWPAVGAMSHREQVPAHEFSQHTPSTQNPLMHSTWLPHGEPFGLVFSQRCVVRLQFAPAAHSAVELQLVPHTAPAQMNGVHGVPAGSMHVPIPSHFDALRYVPAAQLAFLHSVFSGHSAHVPSPAHEPSVWHVEVADCEQLFLMSVPAVAFRHVPVPLHTWHERHWLVGSVPLVTNAEQAPRPSQS